MSGRAGRQNNASVDPAFIALVRSWMQHPSRQLLGLVWSGYEALATTRPQFDGRDLERSITQVLEPRIRDAMSGDEPFYIQHGPFERETMARPPAQPPQYDLAFVLRADERIMWPIEAKVLATSNSVADYVRDVQNEFLSCRYAPFSASGAMLGYLLSGAPDDALAMIAQRLNCILSPIAEYATRPNRRSRHRRSAPVGKPYPVDFDCYHVILEFPDLRRTT